MPWRESCAMDQRVSFIADQRSGMWTMTELCERYEISRKTGYKWLDRYQLEGPGGLTDRSHGRGCMGERRRSTSWMRLWGCGLSGRAGDRARS
jgi:hypothetical protein